MSFARVLSARVKAAVLSTRPLTGKPVRVCVCVPVAVALPVCDWDGVTEGVCEAVRVRVGDADCDLVCEAECDWLGVGEADAVPEGDAVDVVDALPDTLPL